MKADQRRESSGQRGLGSYGLARDPVHLLLAQSSGHSHTVQRGMLDVAGRQSEEEVEVVGKKSPGSSWLPP